MDVTVQFPADELEIAEPLGMRVAFAGRSAAGDHYLVIARNDDTLGDPLPIDEIYSELDDQGGGGYGLVAEIQLRPDRLSVVRTFGGGTETETVEVALRLDGEQNERLREAIRQIMLGCEEHLNICPEGPSEP